MSLTPEQFAAFSDVDTAFHISDDAKISVAFSGIPLDFADDFFRYLGTDEGQDALAATLVNSMLIAGIISPEEALELFQ